jgi:signal peptidase I
MTPALSPGDILWVEKPQTFKRGDIVLVRKPTLLVKRIVGLPGETIELSSSHVTVNKIPLHEPYVSVTASLQPLPNLVVQIPSSSYLVLGDARDDSLDSRRLGPVHVSEIEGVATRRLWPLARWGRLVLLLACGAVTLPHALHAAAPARLLAFASENHLAVMVGKFEPPRKWVRSTNFYEPPEPGDPFTLYGPNGELAEVTITDSRRAYSYGVFADWDAKISPWDNRRFPYALAVSGRVPFPKPDVETIPLDSAPHRAIVSRYLKSRSLHIEEPYLTQAIRIPVEGDGREEALLIAHSDASALSDDKEAAIYAVALLWWKDHDREKVFPLIRQTSFKPAGRTIAEHEQHYGSRDFLRCIGVVDLDGDGWKEIAIYRAKDGGTQIEIFKFNGKRLKKVLSAYKAGYN